MQISASQAASLARPQVQAFETRAQEFLKREVPVLAQRGDPAPLARFVAHGHARAVSHGFASESQIAQYLLVMVHLGPFFDEDPVHAAAFAQALDATSSTDPQRRLRMLLTAATATERHDPASATAVEDSARAAASEFSGAPPGAPVRMGLPTATAETPAT